MSLFDCIDSLENRQQKLKTGPTYYQTFLNFYSKKSRSKYISTIETEMRLIDTLKDKLTLRLAKNHYAHLTEEIALIHDFFKNDKKQLPFQYTDIIKDLLKIDQLRIQHHPLYHKYLRDNPIYMKYQDPRYKIAAMNQTNDHRFGASNGLCHGYTYAMVDASLSPYKNPGQAFPFSKTLHDYQKQQSFENDRIKRQRITRRHFCSNVHQQAEEILKIAEQYIGCELAIHLLGKRFKHIIYLSMLADRRIRYMDANHGAYLLDNKDEWISLYLIISNCAKKFGYNHRSYTIDKLNDIQENFSEESHTWKGKIRTFLTGLKYKQFSMTAFTTILTHHIAINFILAILIHITLSTVSLPLYLSMFLTYSTYFIINLLTIVAALKGFFGVLGIPHLLKDCWHDFQEWSAQPRPSPISDTFSDVVLSFT